MGTYVRSAWYDPNRERVFIRSMIEDGTRSLQTALEDGDKIEELYRFLEHKLYVAGIPDPELRRQELMAGNRDG